jgi:hypothetical protein
MFLPLFMAIFLGFVNPSDTNYSNYSADDIIYITVDDNGQATTNDIGDEEPDTGGEIGSNPPR